MPVTHYLSWTAEQRRLAQEQYELALARAIRAQAPAPAPKTEKVNDRDHTAD